MPTTQLPLKSAMCVKNLTVQNKFKEMYGRYMETLFKTDQFQEFKTRIKQSEEPIHLFLICEDSLETPDDKNEELLISFIEEIQQHNYHPSIIHIHCHENNQYHSRLVTEYTNVFTSFFHEKNLPDREELNKRIKRFFKVDPSINTGEKRGKSYRKKKPNDINGEQMQLSFSVDVLPTDKNKRKSSKTKVVSEKITDVTSDRETTKKNDFVIDRESWEDLSQKDKKMYKETIQASITEQGRYFKFKTAWLEDVQKKTIAVLNLYPRCGSSFLVNNIAISLGNAGVASGVLEGIQRSPRLYYRLGGESSQPRDWECWYKNVQNNSRPFDYKERTVVVPSISDGLSWYQHDVYWIPQHPSTFANEKEIIDVMQSCVVYYQADRIPVLFVDLSHNIQGAFSKFVLEEADEIWIVTDLEFDLLRYHPLTLDFIKNVAGKDKAIHYILNKDIDEIEKKPIYQFFQQNLGIQEPLATIPYLHECNIYDYTRTFAYLNDECKDILFESFIPLYGRILKENTLKSFGEKKKKSSGLLMLSKR